MVTKLSARLTEKLAHRQAFEVEGIRVMLINLLMQM